MITSKAMNPRPIASPVDGEHVAAVYPRSAEDLAVTWHRRLNLFTGRALTAPALALEQAGRAGRFAVRGQVLSPGIVQGLEAALESATTTESVGETTNVVTRQYVNISRGLGLAASGEDVTVPMPLHVNIGDIEVVAPASLAMGGAPASPPNDTSFKALPSLPEPPEARRVWQPLRSLLQQNAQLPPVMMLVLQPVTFESIATGDTGDDCGSGSTSPCEVDPSALAFEDWQLVDGCRLLLYAWPDDWLPLPSRDDRWRNRLAWSVFGAEQGRAADAPMPWEAYGVPLALIAFDTTVATGRTVQWDVGEISWTPLFADRNAVARLGGRPKRRGAVDGFDQNPFLWQARVQQLTEQIASMPQGATPDQIAAQLRYLPPVGLLPKSCIDARAGHDNFFPASYVVSAAPIPVEQADILLQESAGLTPYDLFAPDEIRVYVPVPQVYYEPKLLRTELVDPEFQRSIDAFVLRRGRWLLRRNEVRAKASSLAAGINGKPLEFPARDPDALEDEEPAADAIDPGDPQLRNPEDPYGTTAVGTTLVPDAVTKLKAQLRAGTPLREKTSVPLAALAPTFQFPASVQARIAYDQNTHVLTFTGRMTAAQRDDLLAAAGGSNTFKAAVTQLFTTSQDDDFSRIDELGVSGFIDYVKQKADAADDAVDFGFLRTRTDIYRVRQFMLGTDAATRLSTSPALAEIAKGTSAVATQDELSKFVERVKLGGGGTPPAGGSGTTPPPTGGGGTVRIAGAITTASGAFAAARGGDTVGTHTASPTTSRFTAGSTMLKLESLSTPLARTSATTTAISAARTTQIETVTSGITAAARAAELRASSGVSVSNLPPTTSDVTEQSPIVGKSLEFRSVTVAERLKQPVAPETKSFAVASKFSVMSDLSNLGINVDDLSVPGFLDGTGKETRHTFTEIRAQGLLGQILNDQHDPDPRDGDEASFFAGSVRALENTVAALRLVEGRIQAYRTAAEMANAALVELQRQSSLANARLAAIAQELAEARSDVSVARALLAEEQSRVDGVNQRRSMVLAEHCPFLVYQRTRVSDLVLDVPSRSIDPADTGITPADFLSETVTVPPELDAMVALLRDVPLSWFVHVPRLLDRIDRLDTLHYTLGIAKQRAAISQSAAVAAIPPKGDGTKFGVALAGLYHAQRSIVGTYRAQTAQIDLAAAAAQSWANVRAQAPDVLSISDLVSAVNGRSDVSRNVAQEIDQITRASAVLLERFGDVLPAIRLEWATRLSEYDAPANLRNLASLPRWGEIPILERRAMQEIVDWLFGRVDVSRSDAVAMMNAIVRVCILLASHAPVDRIIAGAVHKDTPLHPGVRIDLEVNLTQVRVGMFVNLYQGPSVVARGVVEDLASGMAAARVTDALESVTSLAAGSRVQLVEPERATVQGLGVPTTAPAADAAGNGVRAPAGSLSSLGRVARVFA